MILIRCKKCRKFYNVKYSACTRCGNKDSRKDYYVRLDNRDTYAGDSLAIAREIDSKLKKDKRLGKIPEYQQKAKASLTFSDYLDTYFLPHYRAKNTHPRNINAPANYFRELFGDKYLHAVQPLDIEKAIAEIRSNRTPRTRDYYLSSIKRMYNYAIEMGLADSSPVKVKVLNVDNTRHRFLTVEEQERFINACAQSESKYLLDMVLIAIYTGMRKGEIAKLKKSQIRDGKIYLPGKLTKNKRGRVIAVHPNIAHIFEKPGELDFNHDISASFYQALVMANLAPVKENYHGPRTDDPETRITFHTLRHTFGSMLMMSGAGDFVRAAIMGHSSPEMSRRYAHLAPEAAQNAIFNLPNGQEKTKKKK